MNLNWISCCFYSLGGLILGFAVDYYNGIAVFQPVINGVGGNLVAVFASRLSTTLHKTAVKGVAADWAPKLVLGFEKFERFRKILKIIFEK
jgi:cation transporter-like permease